MSDFDTEFASFRGQKPQADGATFDDEFSAFRQTKTREQAALRSSVDAAMQTTPEQAAKVKYLSTVTGIDPSVIATQEGEVKARAKLQEIQKEAQFSPILQARLRDPEFTKLAIDDVPTLSKLEQGIGSVMQFVMGADGKGGLPGMVGRGAQKAYYGSVSGTSGVFRAASEFVAPILDPVENVQSIGGNPLRRLAEGFGLIAQGANANSDAIKSPYDGNIAAGAESGFTSLGQNAKYLPLTLAGPAGVAAALVGMSLETGGQSYQKAREKGVGQNLALAYGASDALVEFATEKIPMHRLIGDVAANTNVFKTVAKQIGLEVPGEQIATALQDLNEWAVMNPEKTFGDYIAARPDAAIQTLVATVIGTGGNVAVSKALGTLMDAQTQKEYNDLFNAQRDAQERAAKLQDVMATAAGSKLRELSPETFREHVQAAADGQEGAPKSVHIDGQVLLQTLQSAGITEEQLAQSMPSVVSQLADAAVANSTVEIPIGELATALPGTPLEQAILPHLRIGGPESLSQVEAEQAQQQAQEYLKGESERVMQESQDQAQWAQESEGVKTTIRDQLAATGRFSDDVNSKYATLVRDFYSVMASRTGMTPRALYDLMPYKAGSKAQSGAVLDTAKQDAAMYNQEGKLATESDAFKNWFGDSKVVDAEGKPLVVYHATNADFDAFEVGRETNNSSAFGNYSTARHGVFTAPDVKFAEQYLKKGGGQNVMPVHISVQKPVDLREGIDGQTIRAILDNSEGLSERDFYYMEPEQSWEIFDGDMGEKVRAALLEAGFDGARMVEKGDDGKLHETWIAFNPTQIKSVFNRGTFDPNDANILNQSAIGDKLMARVENEFPALVEEYKALPETNGGQVINTDMARELSPEYRADRTRSAEVHDAASALMSKLYAERLAQPVQEGRAPAVLFTAGGTGAGKSSGLEMMPELAAQSDIIYDGTMSKLKGAVEKIEQALASGRDVQYMYVYREPGEALKNGALPRAMSSGRTAPLQVLQDSHTGARAVAEALAEKYKDNPRVSFIFIDNSHGRGNAKVVALANIPQVPDNGLKEKLNAILDQEYQAGNISDAVYAGTKEPVSAMARSAGNDAGRVQPEVGSAVRGRFEQGGSGELKPAFDQTQTEAFKRWSNDAPLVTSADADTYAFKSGKKVVLEAFHGTKRPDRVGTKFLKKRATSGPMAYHTSSPELASGYASGKSDTSLADEDQRYENWFKYKPQGQRTAVDIVRAWYSLDADTKAAIFEKAPTLRLNDEADGVVAEEGNTSGNGSYDYNLQQTQRGYDRRGNPLKALVEDWLTSGNLFGKEELFMEVLQKAGFPVKDVDYDSPHAAYPFVYKNFIAMQKPLVTSDMPQEVIDALQEAAKKDRSRAKYNVGADTWDKNTKTLKEWVAAFNEADNKYVWTSIPDKVTDVFRSLGYDGIIDWSGKGGGTAYPVYIPFEENQVKSALGNKGKFDGSKNDILKQEAQPNKYQTKYLAGRDLASLNAEERAQYDILATPSDNLAQPQAQGPRGTFNPSTLTTVLNENADLSTFLHETGHFFLEAMATLASQPNADPGVVKDMNALLKWFGVPDLATWQGYTLEEQRKHHERFAESFEQYLLEGKAPNTELASLFRTFRAWLTRVYRSLKEFSAGRDLQLSDDIRQVMDRMVASEEQIAEAEKVAGLVPNLDATGEAIEQLQSRSIRDLKWAVNARNKFIKQMQQDAKAKRKEVEAEVTAEVNAMPEFAAKKALDDLRKATKEKPSDADLAAIADAHGFKDYDSMLSAIEAVGKKADVIEGMTDQRMLERYGDLVDQDSIEQAATEAVHNAARAKSLATELAAQRELLNPRQDTGKTNAKGQKVTVNALVEAAKQFAANVIGRKAVSDLKKAAYNHLQAERRAAKAWEAATAKGDTKAAVQAKQDQMLNNAAVRAANEAQADVKKTMEFFAKVMKGNSESVVEKGRDADIVNAARAILAVYGVGAFRGKNAFEYMDLLKANDPNLFAILDDSVRAAVASAKPVGKMTVDELTALKDEISSMWHLAKSSRQYEVDGDRMDIEDAAEELKARMEAKGVPATMPGDFGAVTEAEKRGRSLQFAGALLRRVESWAEAMDGKFGGPFLKLVFQPVKAAADRYRADRAAYRKQFTKLVENVSPALKPGTIEAPELGYTFGKGKGGVGQAELLSAILHLGNESNKRKLLLGRNWATENEDGTLDTSRWDSFTERMHNTGVIDKAHYDFVQGVWDLLEKMKPLAQKTHRDVYGRYFAEVTASPFEVPGIGYYRGGYVPAQVDPEIVKDNEMRKLAEAENESMAYAFPATNKGFTKSRTEYNRPLMLDLRTLPQHIDKVLLFSHMEPAVRGVSKVLQQKGVGSMLGKIDPAAISGMLTPWLNRSARQIVETPIVGDGRISRVLSVVRARAGMSVMFANLSNTVQQLAGLTLARVKIERGYLLPAMAQYTRNPKKMSEAVAAASSFMATRMDDQVAALNGTVEEILLNPSVYEKAQNWTAKHTYFLQSALDNVVGPVVWSAAYNQALAKGMSEKDAVHFADGTVRQTQGSTLPEDVSRIETGPSYARIFTQFIGYFNMVANTNVTALQNIADDVGLKKGAGKALAIVFFGLLAPAWIAEAIAQGFKGGPDDEDKDGSYLDDWLKAVFGMGTVKTVLAGVPFVGQFAMAGLNTWNGKPYDDRTNLSPAVSMLEGAVGAPHSVYKALVENGSKQKAVRDLATAISLATGLPMSAAARPLGYLTGVAENKINPTGPMDAARGVVTGTASPESKR